ncbi:sulfate transporter CysZ [Candidatus Methylospira mobilis]|uniref:Sulfate transporter CysZ n=1 Tax=Candidatus Methylospira mobilis TaxID=1808979 RepID=A0A5Q0BSV5_9GAMM|nr:sulfate transporter CysZ [Candidatus Methylospira mobilis]QFY44756.1 sulfate transporter CysZ [Candidatus Methylospira mobilis]
MNNTTTLPVIPGVVQCLLRGIAMLPHPQLRRFVIWPLLINLLLYGLGLWLSLHYFAEVMDRLIPAWLEWLRWLLWPLFAMLFFGFAFFTFTLVANLIGSPFYGHLAEAAAKLAGISAEDSQKTKPAALKQIGISIASELRRLRFSAGWGLALLLIMLIPGVNMLAPPLALAFFAWSLAIEYSGYALEARDATFDEQLALLKKRRIEWLSFGGLVLAGLTIPVFSVIVPPAAVVAATLLIGKNESV